MVWCAVVDRTVSSRQDGFGFDSAQWAFCMFSAWVLSGYSGFLLQFKEMLRGLG